MDRHQSHDGAAGSTAIAGVPPVKSRRRLVRVRGDNGGSRGAGGIAGGIGIDGDSAGSHDGARVIARAGNRRGHVHGSWHAGGHGLSNRGGRGQLRDAFQQHRSLRDGGRNRGGNERGDGPSGKPSSGTGSEDAGEHAGPAARGADRRAGINVGGLLGAGTGTGSVDSIDTVDVSMGKTQVEEVELLKTKEDVLVLALEVELKADEETVEELPEADSVVGVEVLASGTELVTTVTDWAPGGVTVRVVKPNKANASSNTHAHGHKCQDNSEQDRGAARD
ncbi:hypothetical protein PG984_000468 [Apiospora sp. TS-2023a]